MDERKQRILHAIIQDYIKSAEPVGSRTIARNYSLGISSATVRNEMYDLEQLGFLEQPHTSAGRIPSSKGYRFYVDKMLTPVAFAPDDVTAIKELWERKSGNFEEFFLATAKLISKVSHNMSMVLSPGHDVAVFKFIHILPVDDRSALLVVVADAYALDNEILHLDEKVEPQDLMSLAAKLTNVLAHTLLCDVEKNLREVNFQDNNVSHHVVTVIILALIRAVSKRKFFHSVGTLELLGQPEFKSFDKMQPILSLLEEKEQVNKLLSGKSSEPITIKIGQENEDNAIKDCSLIQADFVTEKGKVGTVAILGPTRMEYERVLNMLHYIQHFIYHVKDE